MTYPPQQPISQPSGSWDPNQQQMQAAPAKPSLKFSPLDLGIVGVGALGALVAFISSFLTWIHIKAGSDYIRVLGTGSCSASGKGDCDKVVKDFPANGLFVLLVSLALIGCFVTYLLLKQRNVTIISLLFALSLSALGLSLVSCAIGAAGQFSVILKYFSGSKMTISISSPGPIIGMVGFILTLLASCLGLYLTATKKQNA